MLEHEDGWMPLSLLRLGPAAVQSLPLSLGQGSRENRPGYREPCGGLRRVGGVSICVRFSCAGRLAALLAGVWRCDDEDDEQPR
jgi:hypothetical protein